jgi:acyl-CoA dehydrogenase
MSTDTETRSSVALLGAELGEVRDAVHEAARGVVERYDRRYWLECARSGRFTDDMWQAMGEQGLLGLGVPEQHGGSGGGVTETVAAMEAISAAGVPLALYLLTAFARETILRHGTAEQCERFVRPTASGDERMCFAITEPNAGTNTFAMESFATRTDGGYLLNGQKIFISGVDAADTMMVVARTERRANVADRRQGLSIFVVDVKSAGLSFDLLDIGMVMPDRQFTVHFDDVEVAADRLVGREGEGFRALFDGLNPERLLSAAWGIGLGDFALSKAVAYARERAPFGRPIGGYQGLQHPLARAYARLDGARLMMYSAARAFDGGSTAGYLANAAKLVASEAAVDACDAAIQVHGGYAFEAETDVATIWPVVRLLRIAPVNNEMILNYIGEHVLRLPRSY